MFDFLKSEKNKPQNKSELGLDSDDDIKLSQKDNKNWLNRLKTGLLKSSSKLNEGIKDIFIRKKLDQDTLDELEELLITSDLGLGATNLVIEQLAKNKFNKEITAQEVKEHLSASIEAILKNVAIPIIIDESHKPHVILMCGVNGTGKTTTIGKIAAHYNKTGKKVMIAACDTFRAAAVEQLEVWAKRSNCAIVKKDEGADPASVAYEAYEKARNEKYDLLIIDTAGRLQNKKNLMEQLTKIIKVLKKIDESSIIYLDANNLYGWAMSSHLPYKNFKWNYDE